MRAKASPCPAGRRRRYILGGVSSSCGARHWLQLSANKVGIRAARAKCNGDRLDERCVRMGNRDFSSLGDPEPTSNPLLVMLCRAWWADVRSGAEMPEAGGTLVRRVADGSAQRRSDNLLGENSCCEGTVKPRTQPTRSIERRTSSATNCANGSISWKTLARSSAAR